MTRTPQGWLRLGGLGLATLAGCIGDLDVGKKPNINLPPMDTDGSDEAEGPGMTSSMLPGTSSGDESTDDESTDDDTTTGAPSDVSPPCELGGAGPGQDPAVQWGVVCGGQTQELIHAVAVDGTGAIYATTQVEGPVPSTVLMGDDEITSTGFLPTLLVTKLAPDGEILWNRSFFGEQAWWYGGSLAVCDDRVYLVANRGSLPELIDFGTGIVDGNMAVVAFDTQTGETQWAMATGQDDEFSGGFPVGAVSCRGDGVVIEGSTAVDVVLDDVMLDGSLDTVDTGYVVVLDSDGHASWGAFETMLTASAALGPAGELVTLGYAPGGAGLARRAADGTLDWQQTFPATSGVTLTSVAIDDAGGITIAGGFSDQLDLGLGPLVNGDPPNDPLDPTDDWSLSDGFVAHYDTTGTVQWNTVLAEIGYDYVVIAGLASDGTPAVQWGSPAGTQLLAVDGVTTAPVATLPGIYVQTISRHPTGGFAVAWTEPSQLTPFAPPLTARGGLDFVIARLVP